MWNWFSDIFNAIGNITTSIVEGIGKLFEPVLEFLEFIWEAICEIPNVLGGLLQSIWDAICEIPKVLGNLLQFIWDSIKNIIDFLNPFSENFFGYKLLELLGNLLQWLFVPKDGYFDGIIEDLKEKISKKIPYQDYIDMFETIKQVKEDGNLSVGMKGYNFGQGLTYNNDKFIDFSFVTKYKNTWYAWVRGFVFIFLIIYNVNQVMKFFRGYNLADGISSTNSSSEGGGQ